MAQSRQAQPYPRAPRHCQDPSQDLRTRKDPPSGDRFFATVDQSAAAGKNVSLRVDVTDEHGNGVRQIIVRAYGVQ